MVPQSKIPAATRIVLAEYQDNKIDVELSVNCEKEAWSFDPTDDSEDLENEGLSIRISWGPN